MQWFTQELFLEILLLPTAILAFAHSSLFAYELLQSKSAVPPKHATAWQRLIVWHTILPLAGIICAAYMLTTKEDEWGVFGSTDPAEVLLILICSLAAGLGKSTHNRLTIGRVPILWRVVGFHMIATTAAILSSVLMSFVFAGHFAIEVSAANQFTTGSPAGTPWQDRQNAWITILWIAIPPHDHVRLCMDNNHRTTTDTCAALPLLWYPFDRINLILCTYLHGAGMADSCPQ